MVFKILFSLSRILEQGAGEELRREEWLHERKNVVKSFGNSSLTGVWKRTEGLYYKEPQDHSVHRTDMAPG